MLEPSKLRPQETQLRAKFLKEEPQLKSKTTNMQTEGQLKTEFLLCPTTTKYFNPILHQTHNSIWMLYNDLLGIKLVLQNDPNGLLNSNSQIFRVSNTVKNKHQLSFYITTQSFSAYAVSHVALKTDTFNCLKNNLPVPRIDFFKTSPSFIF